MNIIFQINGGLGKSVAATAVCAAIKKQYPKDKLIVVTGYPDVFLSNPNVYRCFGMNQTSYFYEEFIENQDALIFANEPYLETSHILQKVSLAETWCKMNGIKYNGEQPEIFLNKREIDTFSKKYTSDKPIMIIQANGGGQVEHKYSWARDIPFHVVNEVVDHFKDKYSIVVLKRNDQTVYENTYSIQDDFRGLCVLLQLSEKRLLIDSFAQHTAAALNLPSTVCWIATLPKVFGYNIHNNIIANPFTVKPELKNSYLYKFNFNGNIVEFPYNDEYEIFNTQDIIDSLEN